MKPLAYALAGCLFALLAPNVMADTGPALIKMTAEPAQAEPHPYCMVVAYRLDPPAYRIYLECLPNPPIGL